MKIIIIIILIEAQVAALSRIARYDITPQTSML